MTSPCHVIYGSQTGQSEAISEQIARQAEEKGVEVVLRCGDEVEVSELDNQVVVFVVSSTGEGDPPENFEDFWVALNTTPPRNLTFSVLGLGDSNYTEFGGFPTALQQFLTGLESSREFYEFQLADDQVGLELVVEPWIEGLWEVLARQQDHTTLLLHKLSQLNLDLDYPPSKQLYQISFQDKEFNHEFPYGVKDFILPFSNSPLEKSVVTNKTCLVEKSDHTKETFEIELSTDLEIGAGDSFGLLCHNPDSEVWDVIARLGLTSSAHKTYNLTPNPDVKPRLRPKHVMLECSVFYAVKYTLDLRSLPKKALLMYLSRCCEEEKDSRCLFYLASKEGSEDLNELIYSKSLTFLELLTLFPSCRPHFEVLLQHLPRLTPRYYSTSMMTSEVVTSSRRVSFVFNHITNIRPTTPAIPGVCSSMLRGLQLGSEVYIYRRKNEKFRPTDRAVPVCMIGAGTGVAPFLGFLDYYNSCDKSEGRTLTLITGNRYEAKDSVYKAEFTGYLAAGVLDHYLPAFSRDLASQYKYVQEVMTSHPVMTSLVGLVAGEGVVYVCGDAKGLSVGVRDTLVRIVAEKKGLSEAEAQGLVSEMKKGGRYCEDIWC